MKRISLVRTQIDCSKWETYMNTLTVQREHTPEGQGLQETRENNS